MFYKDQKGIDICQLGTGNVSVSTIEWSNVSSQECVGVVFGETDKGEIGRRLEHIEGNRDCDVGVKFKLLFTKPESIDVVINKLKEAKAQMLCGEVKK
ncbi:MAG: hypothetical protein GY928_00525 [Colwellia sp.]|nr:hypothetical protein [Colwellia sp.]